MATTDKVLFREIGLGVLQFILFLHFTILQLLILILLRQPQRCPCANFHIAMSAGYLANLRCERWGLQKNPIGPTFLIGLNPFYSGFFNFSYTMMTDAHTQCSTRGVQYQRKPREAAVNFYPYSPFRPIILWLTKGKRFYMASESLLSCISPFFCI